MHPPNRNINTRFITTNYTTLITDDIVIADATAGAITVTLTRFPDGAEHELLVIKSDASANTVTVNGIVLSAQNASAMLTEDATGVWRTAATGGVGTGGGGTPGGANTQVQFNDSSAFGGDAGFTFDKTTKALILVESSIYSVILNNNATLGQIALFSAGDGVNNYPFTGFYASRGTLAAPSTNLSGDVLAYWDIFGHNGADYMSSASMQVYAEGTPTPSTGYVPTAFYFSTGNDSGNTVTELSISSVGTVSFALNSTNATSPALKGGGAGATLQVRTRNDAADAPLSASALTLSGLTSSLPVFTDASKNLITPAPAVLATGAAHTVDDVITFLQGLKLCKQS